MDLFKQRIKELLITFLFGAFLIVFVAAPFGVLWLLGEYVHEAIPQVFIVLMCFGIVFFYVYHFVNWLIIEPIKAARRQAKVKAIEKKDYMNW